MKTRLSSCRFKFLEPYEDLKEKNNFFFEKQSNKHTNKQTNIKFLILKSISVVLNLAVSDIYFHTF